MTLKYKPSKYQMDIFKWVKFGSGNAVIQAVAGSGKSSTIILASKLIKTDKKSIFVAFNKAIATELQAKLPKNIEAKTLHSFGLSLFYNNTNSRPKLDNYKLKNIIMKILELNNIKEESSKFKYYNVILKKLIPLLKAELINYKDYGEVNDIIIRRNIEMDLNEEIFEMVGNIMDKCKNMTNIIDFDDMIWIPIVNNFKASAYDFVMCDEQQDLSKIQFALIKKMCNDTTRIIAVGDRFQAIYSFRGADSESMNNFKDYFNAKEFPLSICYRCPKSHIKLAKELVPHIECSENAREGILEDISFNKAIEKAEDNDLVLCRTNAPLVKIAFALIRSDKKAVIRGRNIGKNLITMINKYKNYINLDDLLEKIMSFKMLQEKKMDLIEQGEYDHRKKPILMNAIDSCDTIIFIGENVENINELKNKIEIIFSDEKEGIICSSIHKAKGLEADKVFILDYKNMPHPMAKTNDEIEQENNIKYVALTRAKKELYFIESVEK